MKLIRLTTEDEKAFFRSRFNTDIIIAPLSQVALQNFSAEIVQPSLLISATQRELAFQFDVESGGQEVRALLSTRDEPYSTSNWADLLKEIQVSLNRNITVVNPTELTGLDALMAIEFASGVSTDLRATIEYRYSLSNYFNSLLSHGVLVQNLDADTGRWAGTASTNGYAQALLGTAPLCRGTGFLRCQVHTSTEDAGADPGLKEQGFLIAFTRLNTANIYPEDFPTPEAPVNDQNDTIVFGIGVSFSGGNRRYYIQKGSTVTESVITPNYLGAGNAANDFLELRLIGNQIFALRFKDGEAAADQLAVHDIVDFNTDETYYPCAFFHSGETEAVIGQFSWTPSPYEPNINLGTESVAVPAPFNGFVPRPVRTFANKATIGFQTQAMADFLGFEANDFDAGEQLYYTASYSGELRSLEAKGSKLFQVRAQDPHLMVELTSNPIESYDSQPGVRKSLLSTMIRYQPDGKIQSEPPRTFIDLGNAQPINLKNVEVRLVDNSYQPVSVKGRSICTLLVKERAEAA
jgi:hypothetical protein